MQKQSSILRGGIGSIKITLGDGAGKDNFIGIPNYLGDNLDDGDYDGVNFTFEYPDEDRRYLIGLDVIGSAFSSKEILVEICIDEQCQAFDKAESSYEFIIENPKTLYLKSRQDIAYIVLKQLNYKYLD